MSAMRIVVRDVDCCKSLMVQERHGDIRVGDASAVESCDVAKIFQIDAEDAVQFFSAALALAQSVVRSRGKNA